VLGQYGRRKINMFKKLKMPKMPKVKMPDVVGKTKSLGNSMKAGMGGSVKAATKGLKNLNPFRK
jgi:hypothetical protein|tara:strand:- start:50 stop:241 length:192 start_codon:yes stop_codon:yes gene_type:complete